MSIQIVIILFFSIIVLSRIVFSANYRIYYMITAFFSLRLWMAILASIYYSSGNVYMDEIEEYTKSSLEITLTLFVIASVYLLLESIAVKYLATQYKTFNSLPRSNIYFKTLIYFVIFYCLINVYLTWETIYAFHPINANKMIFINFTHFPYLYKALEPISLFFLVVIAYGLSISKLQEIKISNYKYIIYSIFIMGLFLFTFRFIYIHAKSPYLVMMLLYFITPIYIFTHVFKTQFFKHKIAIYILLIFSSILILFTFYTHYGDTFLIKIGERILLEGQLLYCSLEYFYSTNLPYSFISSFPGNDDESRAMVFLMEQFLPQHKLNQFYATGWQMSGTLPAFNFMFNDMWIAFSYWFMNWIFFIFVIARGIKTFLLGQIIRTFIYFNISFLVGFFYLILGSNYLYSYRFWILLGILIFIELITNIKSNQNNISIQEENR